MTVEEIESKMEGPLMELRMMISGSMMLKAGRMGRPHFRKFHLCADLKHLQWESRNKGATESSVAICDIKELLTGQKTKVFEGNPIPEYEGISFSIMYNRGNVIRSLDIVCKDRCEYDNWTLGLQALIDGFDDAESVNSLMFSETDGDRISLEKTYLFGDKVSVKEDACDIYTWGASPKGTLGHGEEMEELHPRVVEALLGRDVRTVACGTEHTIAVSVSGEIFSWGSGKGGKLGQKNIHDRYMPLKVGALEDKTISYVSCSELHSAVITDAGELYTFGRAGPWLGYPTEGRKQTSPRKVEALSSHHVVKVSCGLDFTIVLTTSGCLYAFGENEFGQLGTENSDSSEQPRLIEELNDVKISEISCGAKHAGAVTENGDVWLWGCNDFGQLGTSDPQTQNLPIETPSTVWNEEIRDIKCGGNHTVVLTCTGTIYCFGNGQSGQLGIELKEDVSFLFTPCSVVMPNQEKVTRIECGGSHTAAVTESGCLYTWGKGSRGRLGHGDHKDRFLPTLVESLAYKQVQSISCGGRHTAVCVIRAWVHDQETKSCMACKLRFTTMRRRHHCRKCGGVFCGPCTQKKCPILDMGYSEAVRVCDRCYNMLTESTS